MKRNIKLFHLFSKAFSLNFSYSLVFFNIQILLISYYTCDKCVLYDPSSNTVRRSWAHGSNGLVMQVPYTKIKKAKF